MFDDDVNAQLKKINMSKRERRRDLLNEVKKIKISKRKNER